MEGFRGSLGSSREHRTEFSQHLKAMAEKHVTEGGNGLSIGIIRVVTTEDRPFLETHANLISGYLNCPGVHFVTDCIRGFPEGIPNRAEEKRAAPFVKETGLQLVRKSNVDSLLISCAGDPGVKELKREVSIPVVGAGSASAHFALMLGSRVCVLGIEKEAPLIVQRILGKCLVGYVKPPDVQTTHDIQKNFTEYVEISRRAVVEKKADVVLLACTGLSTARIAPVLEKELKRPVVDAVLASGIAAFYAAKRNTIRSDEK